MTKFNLKLALDTLETKRGFIASAITSIEKLTSLGLVQTIGSEKELLEAKKARLDLEQQYNAELKEQSLLATIVANRTKAETEIEEILESLPDNCAAALYKCCKAFCVVFGVTPKVDYRDILKRVEAGFFTFNLNDGKRVNLTCNIGNLKKLAGMLEALKLIETVHSGMSLEQRAELFSEFDKLNEELKLFNNGELPDASHAPVQAPHGFTSSEVDAKAAHAVPREPVFNSLASFFDKVEGTLIVNSAEGVDIVRKLLKTASENRTFSMFKAVKTFRKNPQAALIGVIDNFDIIVQGYLNVAMASFINGEGLSQLDRLFSSPTMVNNGQLTPYGRQVRAYIACVLPYVTLKHRGEGFKKVYFFEPVKFNRFSKLCISEKPGFYAFGVRSKTGEDGSSSEDATLPLICIRSHFTIVKALRELKKADDQRIREAHEREWHDYRALYGKEYDRRTLQSEIDSISAALSSKTLELAKLG